MSFSSNNNEFRITIEGDATKLTAASLTEALLEMLAQVQESQQVQKSQKSNAHSVADTDGEQLADRLPRRKTRQNLPKVKKVNEVMKKKSKVQGKRGQGQPLRKCKSCQTTENYYAKGFCKPCYRDDYYGRKRQEKVAEEQSQNETDAEIETQFDTSLLFSPHSSKMSQFEPKSSTNYLMFSQVNSSTEPSPSMSDQYVEPNPSLRF